jgi:hypothetical protein
MSIRNWFRNTFTRRHRTSAEILSADIAARQSARQRHWIEFAANGNRLTASERRAVVREFERLAPICGLAEARRMACDYAANLARHRMRRQVCSGIRFDGPEAA